MTQKYLNLEEAARFLGVTKDDLNRMRERGEVKGFNDGGTWKFYQQEIEAKKGQLGNEESSVLMGDLDMAPGSGMGTVLGSARDAQDDEVFMEQSDAGDSNILGDHAPTGEPGASRTFVGNVKLSPADSVVRLETGGAKGGSGSGVLEGMLDSSGERDMGTVLGGPGSGIHSASKVKIETAAGDSGVVLEGDLEGGSGGHQTVLGSHDEIRAASKGGNVQISTGGVDEDDDSEQVLLGGHAADRNDPGASKTIIGMPSKTSESDIKVVVKDSPSAEIQLTPSMHKPTDSDVRLVPAASEPADSDVKLSSKNQTAAPEETISLGSAADLALDDDSMSIDLGDTSVKQGADNIADHGEETEDTTDGHVGVGPNMGLHDETEDVTLDLGGPGAMEGDDDLILSSDAGGSDITISSSQSGLKPGGITAADSGLSLESPLQLAPSGSDGGSGVDLEADDDDEFVLSSSGSDITRRPGESGIGIGAGESGIALATLADSGISLESPLDLGAGASNLGASGITAGGDFLLTPVDDEGEDDSSDSGSQVIALDDAGELDDAAQTMLGPETEPGTMLEPEYAGAPAHAPAQQRMPMNVGAALSPGMAPAGMPMNFAPAPVAMPFSGLQVTALTFCLIFLILGGMMSFDLMSNMWSWEAKVSPYTSSIMDWIINLIEKQG